MNPDLAYFLVKFIRTVASFLELAILLRILMSWVRATGRRIDGSIVQVLHDLTEPMLRLARKIPHKVGMFDLSPIIAMFGINVIGNILISFLATFL